MILLAHIAAALVSVAYTTYLFFFPTSNGLRLAQALVVLTLASGSYLIVSTSSNMLHACLNGLLYIAVVATGLALAKGRLNAQSPE